MPIDPSIPLSTRPAQFSLGDIFGAMQAGQQIRANNLRLRQAERDQADDDAINEALRRSVSPETGVPDYNAAASWLEQNRMGIPAQKLRMSAHAMAKAKAEAAKVELESRAEGFKFLDQQLGTAYGLLDGVKNNPNGYGQVRTAISKMLGPEIGGLLPEAYDKAKIEAAMAIGQNTQAALKTREQVTREIAQNGLTAKNDREAIDFWTKQLGSWLSTSDSAEDWQASLEMARGLNVPTAVFANFRPEWSPAAQAEAKLAGVDPKDRAQITETKRHNEAVEGLTRTGQAETRRHNLAAEKLSAEQVGVARQALTQKDLDPNVIGPLADMAIRDPEILKQFTATERGKIMRFIASDRGGEFPNQRVQSMLDIVDQTKQTLTALNNHPGLAGAVGAKGPTSAFGYMDKPMAGTNAGDFTALFDTLKSRLTLPRLELMRGLGAMSEKEFKALSDAATSLTRDMSESAFTTELQTITTNLQAVEDRLRGRLNTGNGVGGLQVAPGGGLPSDGGMVQMVAPDGRPLTVPAAMVAEAERRGARRAR